MHRLFLVLPLAAVLATACDERSETDGGTPDSGAPPEDAGTDAGPSCNGPPGLYEEGSCEVLAEGVVAFHPRFPLWSDAAEKERFIYLPPGGTIVTDDPDNWAFPVGTRVYKTFSHDGVRLETRLLEKTATGVGVGVWSMRAYAWNAAQDSVTDVTNEGLALRENVLGTQHDIPSGEQCQECHSASQDVLNGFSAIQLNHADGGVSLAWLLSNYPTSAAVVPADSDVPGDAVAQAALGYLHANCGHCHRETPMAGCDLATMNCCNNAACSTGLHLSLRVADTSVETTTAHATAVGQRSFFFVADSPCRIEPADPDHSVAFHRMNNRGGAVQMPPLGTEIVDPAGISALRAWISALTPTGTEPCLTTP